MKKIFILFSMLALPLFSFAGEADLTLPTISKISHFSMIIFPDGVY
jgi:hypothetical protein